MEPPSLWGCCDSIDDACCCVGALFCPAISYGLTYARATHHEQSACCCPCLVHGCLDALLPSSANAIVPAASSSYVSIPLGCCLRAWQRSAIVNAHFRHPDETDEHVCESLLLETFCWPCSAVQVRKLLMEARAQDLPPMVGNALLGTLTQPPAHVNAQPQHA